MTSQTSRRKRIERVSPHSSSSQRVAIHTWTGPVQLDVLRQPAGKPGDKKLFLSQKENLLFAGTEFHIKAIVDVGTAESLRFGAAEMSGPKPGSSSSSFGLWWFCSCSDTMYWPRQAIKYRLLPVRFRATQLAAV